MLKKLCLYLVNKYVVIIKYLNIFEYFHAIIHLQIQEGLILEKTIFFGI